MTHFLIIRRAFRRCLPQPSAVVYYPKARWTRTEIALSILGVVAIALSMGLVLDGLFWLAQWVRSL